MKITKTTIFIVWRNLRNKKMDEIKAKQAKQAEPFKPGIYIFGFGLILRKSRIRSAITRCILSRINYRTNDSNCDSR